MNHALCFLRFVLSLVCLGRVADTGRQAAADTTSQPAITRTAQMPSLPQPFVMRDWTQVTRDYIDLVLTFDAQGKHLPLVQWMSGDHNMVSFPSYVGGPRDAEAINFLGAVVSGSLVGLDMRNHRGQDWVELGNNFFNVEEGIYINRLGDESGSSFWYDLLPNVLAYQVNALYPEDSIREQQARSIAEGWQKVTVALGGKADDPVSLPNFDHTGFNLRTMQPKEKVWIEPEAAAGIAWLEYMAWVKFKDPEFLTSADLAIHALEVRPPEKSALYEVLLPYGALIAARMNAELGKEYDVAKLVNDCFEARPRPQARPGWGVISDRWQGMDVHGLVGSTTDGQGYAFAMNSFQWAGALVPLARYDTRYAHDIGKWVLNLANASRLFYPDSHDAAHQSSSEWSFAHDPKSVIAYEGLRKWKRGSETARADYKTVGGIVAQGNVESTHYRRELPANLQVFEEIAGSEQPFEHIWEFDLPTVQGRWLVVAAERLDGGNTGNEFRFSYSDRPAGPYTPAFSVRGEDPAQVVALPATLQSKLYVKVESSKRAADSQHKDRLVVDAMAISYQSNIGPFAQGDTVVSFVNLLNEARVPIVLYRPASASTDLGLYGSSHVGILGGIIGRTNVPAILRLDLLKTDYFHERAYPTYLYYNPLPTTKSINIHVGPVPADLYDATNDQFIEQNVRGETHFMLPSDDARVIVLTPTGGRLHREKRGILIDGVVVRYAN
jgi:hypothetical protein